MTKQDILNNTGLSEEEFYQRYPDQETFCSEYPDMCPDMMEDDEEEGISNYQNLGYDESEINMAAYGGSMYEAQDGVETTAPYTDYNQYQKAMQNYGTEASKAGTYNSFQNDLYNQSGKSRGSSETTSQLGDMFNTLSPEQQDALAQKYGAQFMPSSTPSASRRNYVNSMEMNVPGKGTGYYSFPTNDVVYGSKQLERPNYEFPKMTAPQYPMPPTPPKKFSVEPTQLINNISAGYKNPASLNTSNGNLPIPKYSMTNTMEKVGATNKPYVASAPNYSSIIDLLKARKQDSSFTNRKRLAEEAGIKNYTGSASQNMDFINRINGIKSSGTEMELGGVNIHPAMRTNFKQGGYYGMDGKLHKAKGSGTYVMNGGYYFQPGGTNTAPPVASPDTPPGAMGDPASVPPSSLIDKNMPNADGTFNIDPNETYDTEDDIDNADADFGDSTGNTRQQRRQARRNAPYEMNDLGGLDPAYEQQDEQPVIEPYDPSQYSSAVDPVTGFTNYSKGNKALTNIKKQDNALWQQLKEEGNGARFRTGQTDIQKVGRAAGRLANNLEMGVNIAGAVGNVLNNKFQQRSLNNSAINKGSTASMYTNPQGAGKGDYGQTGSGYGMMDPTSVGSRSFKGMYGKYGMEVPRYDVGGFAPQVATLSDVGLESLNPNTFNVSSSANYLPAITPTNFVSTPRPVVDNTRVYQDNQNVQYDFSKPLGKGLDVSGNPKLMKELFTYAQNQYGTADKKKIKGINEMAWNPMGVYNDGIYNPKGKWKGHDGHIHFGFENPDVAVDIIKKAQALGLVAKENPYLSGKNITKGHTDDSFHYRNFNANDYKPTSQPKNYNTTTFNNKGSDVSTKLNNPGNILYNPAFENFGAVKSKINATDSGKPFASFPSIEMGLKAREAQLFGEVDGTFSSKYYKPNTDIDKALKTWSGGGYGVEIYPELRGKTLSQITAAERKELQKRQIKRESGAMYKQIYKKEGGQFGGQVVEMDEDEVKQFLKAGGQLEFLD